MDPIVVRAPKSMKKVLGIDPQKKYVKAARKHQTQVDSPRPRKKGIRILLNFVVHVGLL